MIPTQFITVDQRKMHSVTFGDIVLRMHFEAH